MVYDPHEMIFEIIHRAYFFLLVQLFVMTYSLENLYSEYTLHGEND